MTLTIHPFNVAKLCTHASIDLTTIIIIMLFACDKQCLKYGGITIVINENQAVMKANLNWAVIMVRTGYITDGSGAAVAYLLTELI